MRDRRKRNIIIGSLCCLLVFMGIGYAVLSQILNITGTASVNSSWKILITNIAETKVTGSAQSEKDTPTFTDKSATFSALLKKPGDSITYTVTVANQGTIDAVLSLKSTVGSEHKDISFSNDLVSGEILKAGSERQFNVYVKFNESAEDVGEILSTYTIELTYTQYDGNNLYDPANVTTDNGVFKVSSDGKLMDYNEEMGTYVSIPAEIDGIPITSISSDAFKQATTSYNYQFKVSFDSNDEPVFIVVFDEENKSEIQSAIDEGMGSSFVYYSVGDSNIPTSGFSYYGYCNLSSGGPDCINPNESDSGFLGETTINKTLKIKSLDLSNATNLQSIDDYAFSNASDSTTLAGLETIPEGLTTLTFGDNVNEIGLGRGAFAGANLQTLKVYSTLKSNITLDQITSIGTLEKNNPLAYLLYPFSKSNINNLVIQSVTSNNSFLANYVSLPDSEMYISISTFSYADIASLNVENGIEEIGNYAFNLTKLNNVKLPNSLKKIGDLAFDSTGLTSITIPKSVNEIGKYAFDENDSLTITMSGRSNSSGMTLGSGWNGTATVNYAG